MQGVDKKHTRPSYNVCLLLKKDNAAIGIKFKS